MRVLFKNELWSRQPVIRTKGGGVVLDNNETPSFVAFPGIGQLFRMENLVIIIFFRIVTTKECHSRETKSGSGRASFP